MSLSVAGVWQVGVWATTVWADGVWHEGAAQVAAPFGSAHSGPRRRKPKHVQWRQYATSDERIEAMAQALAETAIPIHADDEIEEEDELIRMIVLSKVIQ